MGQGKQGEDEERARWGQGLRQGQGRPGQGQGDSKVHMSNNYTLLLVILDLLGSTRVRTNSDCSTIHTIPVPVSDMEGITDLNQLKRIIQEECEPQINESMLQ